MNKLVNARRLIIDENMIYIESFEKVLKIESEEIETKNFIINGNNLKISSIDRHLLVIKGQVLNIRRKYEHL